MENLDPAITEKFRLIQSLVPTLRSRSSTIRKTYFEAALQRIYDLTKAEEELDYVIEVCDEVLRA